MTLKLVACTLAVSALAFATPAAAQGPRPAAEPSPNASPTGLAHGRAFSATNPPPGLAVAAAAQSATPRAVASEPLTAVAVALGLLGARYIRRRS